MIENKNRKLIYTIVLTVSLLLIAYTIRQANQVENPKYYYLQGKVFGTYYHITYEGDSDFTKQIDSVFIDFDSSLSTYNKNSIISRVNRNEETNLDVYFTNLFVQAKHCSEKTNGAFDITVTPLVDAWGFGSGKKLNDVDEAIVDSLLDYVGMDRVQLINNKIIKEKPEIQFNVNAVAKGYGVDVIADFLETKNIKNYLVEIGGELRALGRNAKHRIWTAGINKPVDDSTQMNQELQDEIIELSSGAMATSGNYRNFYIKEGKKYAHTINPKTGYPVSHNLLSATVCMPTCLEADALATAFMVVGFEEGKLLANKLNAPVYFIYNENNQNKIYMSDSFKKLLKE